MPVLRLLTLIVLAAMAFAGKPNDAPYPPPGTMIDLGGYRVHVHCVGAGEPTVLIVGGGFSFDWTIVQTAIARTARVCVYDPSGTAWSDPGPGRDCPAWVNEVHELVGRAHIARPLILVGFSAGAIIARLYAIQYPVETAGVVLVDHAFLPEVETHAPPPPAADLNAADSPPAVLSMTPIIGTHEDEPGFNNLPEEARKLDRWATSMNPDLPTPETAAQCMEVAEAAAQGKDYPLRDMPLVVIRTGNETPGYEKLQNHLLRLSRDSRQLVASASVHSVEISQPDVVVDGIQQVISAVRSRSHLNLSTK